MVARLLQHVTKENELYLKWRKEGNEFQLPFCRVPLYSFLGEVGGGTEVLVQC